MKARGKYIVIEGQDGTGKTTQANLLQTYLHKQGVKTIHIKEPGGSPVAEAIRDVILNGRLSRQPMTNILLFTANRHELWHDIIKPSLDEGTWVICTRNYWSTLAYQGYGEGQNMDEIITITEQFTHPDYMQPNHGIVLSLPDDNARRERLKQRGTNPSADTFEAKPDDFQSRVNNGYLKIAKQFSLPLVNASRPIEVVQAEILDLMGLV